MFQIFGNLDICIFLDFSIFFTIALLRQQLERHLMNSNIQQNCPKRGASRGWSFWLINDRCCRSARGTEWRYQNFDRNRYRDFFYDTKFSETDTETFFRDQIFQKPKSILFFQDQIFRNRNWDFFPRPNFSGTETFFPKPKPRLFFWDQMFWNRNPQKFGKSRETET